MSTYMMPHQRFEYIIGLFDSFQCNVNNMIEQAKYNIKYTMGIKNIDEIIASLTEKISFLIELQFRNVFDDDGQLKNPKNFTKNFDQIINSLQEKINKTTKVVFEEYLEKATESKINT